jgi:oxazoline/thiazoline dehydrogenase
VILTLRPPARVTPHGRGGLRIQASTGTVTFQALPPKVRRALVRLREGVSADDVRALVGGGIERHASWYYCVRTLDRIGAVVYEVLLRGKPLARTIVMSEYFASGPVVAGSRSWRLSRFAYVHREVNRFVLESPQTCAKVELLLPEAMAMIGSLHGNITADALVSSRVPRTAAEDFLDLLCHARMVVPVDETGHTTEDDAEDLQTWHFADFLFHARSRAGRHDEPVTTFRYLGTREPLPALKPPMSRETIALYAPNGNGRGRSRSLDHILRRRRSVRSYGRRAITVEQLGEFLHRSARVDRLIEPDGKRILYQASRRPSPSAGACYELEIYLAVGRCAGLPAGLYHYDPLNHRLEVIPDGATHARHLLRQAVIPEAPLGPRQVLVILSARFQRMSWKYNMAHYAAILKNVGVLFQTMYLVATDMNLAPCAIGGGDSERFARAIGAHFHEETSVGEFMLGSLPAR